MKRSFALLLVAMLAVGTAPAFAQMEGGPHEGPGGHRGPGGPGGHFFADADTNKDGFLTKDEMAAAQAKKLDEMFAKVDTNKDGKLSKEELQKGHEEMRKKMRERFKEMREKRNTEKQDNE